MLHLLFDSAGKSFSSDMQLVFDALSFFITFTKSYDAAASAEE